MIKTFYSTKQPKQNEINKTKLGVTDLEMVFAELLITKDQYPVSVNA